jgi:hypothetical protein
MNREPVASIARYVGALCLVAAGAVHLQQYYAVYYRVIPVIGPLFVANFAIAVVLGVALLAPVPHRAPGLHTAAAIGGILFAAGTIIALEISEDGTLFGFHEHGYRAAIVVSIVFEAAAIVSLATYLISSRVTSTPPAPADAPLAGAS